MITLFPPSRQGIQPAFRSSKRTDAYSPSSQTPKVAFQGGDTVHFGLTTARAVSAAAGLATALVALAGSTAGNGSNAVAAAPPQEDQSVVAQKANLDSTPKLDTIVGDKKCTFSFVELSDAAKKEIPEIENNTGCKFSTTVRMADNKNHKVDIETTDQTLRDLDKNFLKQLTQATVDGFKKIDSQAEFTNHFVVINCTDQNDKCYTLLMRICKEEAGKPPVVTIVPPQQIKHPHNPPVNNPPHNNPPTNEPPTSEPPTNEPPKDCECPEGGYGWLLTQAESLHVRAQAARESGNEALAKQLEDKAEALDKLAYIVRTQAGLPADSPKLNQIKLSPELQTAINNGTLTTQMVIDIHDEGGFEFSDDKDTVGLTPKGKEILDKGPGTQPGAEDPGDIEPRDDTVHSLDWYRNQANRTPGMDKLIAWALENGIDPTTIKVDPALAKMSENEIADLIVNKSLETKDGKITKSEPQTSIEPAVTLVSDPAQTTSQIPVVTDNQTGTSIDPTQTVLKTDPQVVVVDNSTDKTNTTQVVDAPNNGNEPGNNENAGNDNENTGNADEPVVKVAITKDASAPTGKPAVLNTGNTEQSGGNVTHTQGDPGAQETEPVAVDTDSSDSN